MARIRTIKPEFWTDETIVRLPFEARLLFVGLWNFADDYGCLDERPERIRLQILPADTTLDVEAILDLLIAADLLERLQDPGGSRIIRIRNWQKHQKVDNPSRSKIINDTYRRLAIPSESRRALASKYECAPGGQIEAKCYFCPSTGKVIWWNLSSGKPSSWVSFSDLEIDHFKPEAEGGNSLPENLILACRSCNRRRKTKDAVLFLSEHLSKPIEPSPLDQGREGIKERKEESNGHSPDDGFDNWYQTYPLKKGRGQAIRAFKTARQKTDLQTLIAGSIKYRDDPKRKPDYTKYPATWLNGECWKDQASAAQPPRKAPQI